MGYRLGFAGGFADLEEAVPAGGFAPYYAPVRPKAKPKAKPVRRAGRATLRLKVSVTAGRAVAGPGQATKRLVVAARAYDPVLAEQEDLLMLTAALALTGREPLAVAAAAAVVVPPGQEEAAWDRWRDEQWEEARGDG